MKKLNLFLIAVWIFFTYTSVIAQITKPEDFFKFQPGTDKMLFDYEQLINYLKIVDNESPRVKMIQVGKTMLGKPMYLILLSSEKNINNLEKLKEINKELAINAELSNTQIEQYSHEGKVFILATLSMHANEVGPVQAAPLVVYKIATTNNQALLKNLDNVVYMIIPHNPDGMDMVVHNYLKYKGTKYEGTRYPGVYNKYVGHDNNRDFVTLSQSETKIINRFFSKEWFPQVMVEKHQMGARGVRYFVPPKHDPIAINVDAELWTWDGIFGMGMMKDMTEQGLKGVVHTYAFDDYWPGSTETSHWKNVISMLTEVASAKTATPIYQEDNELYVSGKGLSEYKKGSNFPDPWPGGWWRLSDIIKYELASTFSMINTASLHKEEILKLRNRLCKKEIDKGKSTAPFYYIMPLKQHDQSELIRLVNLLKEHGINIYQLNKNIHIDNKLYQKGDIVIPLAQPFRAFIKEVLEAQKFPERHYYKNGKLIMPYDITSWSLPLNSGVKTDEINKIYPEIKQSIVLIEGDFSIKNNQVPEKYVYAVFPAENNESYKAGFLAINMGVKVMRSITYYNDNGIEVAKGSFFIPKTSKMKNILDAVNIAPIFIEHDIKAAKEEVKMPRIALVETYMHDMDAGWTRFIFDNYHIKYTVVHPGEFENTDFTKKFDVVIFPDNDKDILLNGKYKNNDGNYSIPSYPKEFTKGIGNKGMNNLMSFLHSGGKIIAWGRSVKLFSGNLSVSMADKEKEDFVLPFNDISDKLQKQGLYCPGSLVKIKLKKDFDISLGMPEQIGVFYRGRPVFITSIPNFDMDRRVIAKFANENILMSGYAEKIKLIANKSAILWLKKNKGQMILFSFNPQFRASTPAAYKLLFNSILIK